MSIKIERLEKLFTEEISRILRTEVKDKNLQFLTITSAKISSDLSYAKIYYTAFDERKKDQIKESLTKASKYLRTELCKRVDIRKMPELGFVYDESIEYGNKIESIIEKIKEDE